MIKISPTVASQLFKIKKTQLEMIRDRGYDISDEEAVLEYDLKDFTEWYTEKSTEEKKTFRNSLSGTYTKIREPDVGSTMFVRYLDYETKSKNLGLAIVKLVISEMEKNRADYAVLISEQEFTPDASEQLRKGKSGRIQHFMDMELWFNPTKHVLVPRHEVLSKAEQDQVMAAMKEKGSAEGKYQLMGLKYTELGIHDKGRNRYPDAIVKYLGLLPGTIVRIHRVNLSLEGLVNETIVHRVVTY